jgi:hypothetical protein
VHAAIVAPDLLSSLNINTKHGSRRPDIFSMQTYMNNTSYYNPIGRMCRAYNELAGNASTGDIFISGFPRFKAVVSEYLRSENVLNPVII